MESLRDLIEVYDREVAMLDRKIADWLKDDLGYWAIQAIPGVGPVVEGGPVEYARGWRPPAGRGDAQERPRGRPPARSGLPQRSPGDHPRRQHLRHARSTRPHGPSPAPPPLP